MDKKCILILLNIFILISCHNKNGDIKKKYYISGELESYGSYIQDSIPIDTIFSFYKNGNYKSIYVYNKAGNLDGITKTFFENGNLNHEIPYSNGILNGFVNEYDSLTGYLHSKQFHFADTKSGDLYIYKKSQIVYYAFYDFSDRKINHIEYDSSFKISRDIRQEIFLDTLTNLKDGNYQLIVLLSNPPKTYNKIEIQSFSINGNIIECDTISGHDSYIYKEAPLTDTIAGIKIIMNQFDSVLNKFIYQEDTQNFLK